MTIEHDLEHELSGFLKKIGPKSEEAARKLCTVWNVDDSKQLIELLFKSLTEPNGRHVWGDNEAAELLFSIGSLTDGKSRYNQDNREKLWPFWINEHANSAKRVFSCIKTIPPDGVEIEKEISGTGKQKKIFLAKWRPFPGGQDRPIVLKSIDTTNSDNSIVAKILDRERVAHPLSTIHPNIIGTHFLQNRYLETFLVEKKIDALDDNWRAKGVDECSNLIYCIAMALSYIHSNNLIHGDIKPDNIGIDHGDYILLDFGICRTSDRFIEQEATGSLRTRAPELLRGGRNSKASDIWALGASVFNSTGVGRFPLYRSPNPPPSDPSLRSQIANEMAEMAEEQWATLVDQELDTHLPEPLRGVLRLMLAKDSSKRPDARTLVHICETRLAAHIRIHQDNGSFSKHEEALQLIRYIHAGGHDTKSLTKSISLMPIIQKRHWRELLGGPPASARNDEEPIFKIIHEILAKVDKP